MKRSIKVLAFLFIMSFGFGVVQGFAQITSADQKDIWKMEEAFYETFRNGDLKGHMALWHKDARLWGFASEYPTTKTSYERFWEGSKFKIDSYNLDWPVIDIFDNTAIVYFNLKMEGYLREPSLSVRIIHIWTKQDNKWLLIGGMTYRRS